MKQAKHDRGCQRRDEQGLCRAAVFECFGKGFKEEPSKIWESNIFGKSLDDLVNEGLKTKLMHMPNDARMKLQQTLERVINEGCNGLICIII